MIKLKSSNRSVTESDLDEVEKKLGFRFPPQLKDLYLLYNGGQPEGKRRYFQKDEDTWILHGILPIKYGSGLTGSLEQSFQIIRVKNQLVPDFLVPFGFDAFGNYFCFSTRSDDLGAIFFCVMDARDPKSTAKRIAGSLNELLENLKTTFD